MYEIIQYGSMIACICVAICAVVINISKKRKNKDDSK